MTAVGVLFPGVAAQAHRQQETVHIQPFTPVLLRQEGILRDAAAIRQAHEENDLKKAEALYAEAKDAEAQLLQKQKGRTYALECIYAFRRLPFTA